VFFCQHEPPSYSLQLIQAFIRPPDELSGLMVDFYRRMWIEKKLKRQALFEAQEKMRTAKDELGRPKYRTRDWAAWVLVG
jgi:CHAT domain-containing protein